MNLRRDFIKKLAFLGVGVFSLKNANAREDIEKTDIRTLSNLNNLTYRKSRGFGEVINLFKPSESDSKEVNLLDNFTSLPIGSLIPDGCLNIQGPNCIWSRIIDDHLRVEWFGAKGDGVSDDSNALLLASRYAEKKQLPLFFSANRTYLLSKSFNIDISKTAWHGGDNTTLQWKKALSDPAIRIYSSEDTYPKTRINNKIALSSIIILGGGIRDLIASTAISIGGSEKSSSLFSLKNISVLGWDVSLYFSDNSWRIKIEDCLFLWGKIISKPHAVNSGECMYFSNCMFADNYSSTELNSGDWHYVSCSIDNHEIKVCGDASVYFDNGHIENPGRKSEDFTALGIYSKNGFASITNTRLIISDTPKVITTPIFYVTEENNSLGLYINNLRYDQKRNFHPSRDGAQGDFLVGGNGRTVIDNVFTNIINNNFVALSNISSESLREFSFDSNFKGWEKHGDIVFQSKNVKVSESCLMLSENSSIEQNVTLHAGDIITGGLWAKFDSSDFATVRIAIYFSDSSEGREFKEAFNFKRSNSFGWEWIALGAIVPKNNVYCKLVISLGSKLENSSKLYVDGLVMNKTNR